MQLIIEPESIAAAGEHLASSSRGRKAMRDLLTLLENGAMSLDQENQQAFLILLGAAFGDWTGSALEILREAASDQDALENLVSIIKASEERHSRIDPDAVMRFAELAASGASPGASTGERTCNRLAVALHHIGDDLALLDHRVLTGAADLIFSMAGPWPKDSDKEGVYATVRRAAGKDRKRPAKKKAAP